MIRDVYLGSQIQIFPHRSIMSFHCGFGYAKLLYNKLLITLAWNMKILGIFCRFGERVAQANFRIICFLYRARICKNFREPRNPFPAWRYRFRCSLNVYKYGLKLEMNCLDIIFCMEIFFVLAHILQKNGQSKKNMNFSVKCTIPWIF